METEFNDIHIWWKVRVFKSKTEFFTDLESALSFTREYFSKHYEVGQDKITLEMITAYEYGISNS